MARPRGARATVRYMTTVLPTPWTRDVSMNALTDRAMLRGGNTATDVCCPEHPGCGRLRGTAVPGGRLRCPQCGREYAEVEGVADLVPAHPRDAEYLAGESRQWDEHALHYDYKRVRDARYSAAVEAAVAALQLRPGETILDAACGTGSTVRQYAGPGVSVTALDVSMRSLRILKRSHSSVRYVRGDLTALPFADASFDKVVCANAIQHVPDDERRRRCVRELARVVRPGGRVVVTAHQYSAPRRRAGWSKEGPAGSHSGEVRYLYRFGRAEFLALLAAELDVECVRGAGFPLPYRWKLSPVSRALERLLWRSERCAPLADMLVGVGRKRT